MQASYEDRLKITISGNDNTIFNTESGCRLATGYNRVVIGDRGPYVEFELEHLNSDIISETKKRHFYYIELRSDIDDIKIYAQVHPVNYADYVVGKYYVSPFELYDSTGLAMIEPLR